jgi:hypothetical protein
MSRCLKNLESIENPSEQILRSTNIGALITQISAAEHIPGDSVHSFRRRALELAERWHLESCLDTLGAALANQTANHISDNVPTTQEEPSELTHSQPKCLSNTDMLETDLQEAVQCTEASTDDDEETSARPHGVIPAVTSSMAKEDNAGLGTNIDVIDLTEEVTFITLSPVISIDQHGDDFLETSPNSVDPILNSDEGNLACGRCLSQD